MKDKKSFITTIPGKADNYFIFEELAPDALGKNFRAAELHNNLPVNHKLLTLVNPFLFQNPGAWDRTKKLCERLRQADNPNLYVPEKIMDTGYYTLLVFPFRRGKTLAQIAGDASRMQKPIPFELAFAIALAIVTVIEMGSSFIETDQKPFHGFLTADHVLIDYQGNIFLKCFGLWYLFDNNETAISEMTLKYGPWLAPEFIRKEKLLPQSDFYYLGYILYRMLTGNYFSYLPGEDFESTFTSISFVADLPSTDIKFLTTLINFFKKALNPAVKKRFANTREFKNHIVKFFPSSSFPGDFKHFKSNLAVYMKILYSDIIEREEGRLAAELSPQMPENRLPAEEEIHDSMMEIPIEESVREVKNRSKFLLALLIVIILGAAGGTYFLINQLNQAKKEQQMAVQRLEQQNKEKEEFASKLREIQQKLKNLEDQKTSTKEEQQIKDRTISRLKKQEEELKQEVDSREKTGKDTLPAKTIAAKIEKNESGKTDSPKTTNVELSPATAAEEPAAATVEKTEMKESTTALPPGSNTPAAPGTTGTMGSVGMMDTTGSTGTPDVPPPLPVPLAELTVNPNKLSGPDPKFPPHIIKTYVGRRATVNARLLIAENGGVTRVEMMDGQKIPADVQRIISDTLKKWEFTPPQKGDQKVKVWWPLKLKIHFKREDI
jgi:hypothetical protein